MTIIKYLWKEFNNPLDSAFLHQKNVYETAHIHSHDFYEVFLVIGGNSLHNVNNITSLLKRGHLVFIRPNDVHFYELYKTSDFEFLNISFTTEKIESLNCFIDLKTEMDTILNNPFPPEIILNESDIIRISNMFYELANIIEKNNSHLLKLKTSIFLPTIFSEFYLNDYISNNDEQKFPDWFVNLLASMNRIDNFYLGLNRMIELSNCSQEHLNRTCKKYLNQTPTEIINEIRLNYAANLLLNSSKTVLDICQDIGFNNLSYFYKIFKKKYNCTPYHFKVQG